MLRLFYLAALVMLTACSGIEVSQDYDTEMTFPRLQTYAWKNQLVDKHDDVRADNPLLHKRFRQNIDRVLEEKGFFQRVPADFLVDYSYSITTRLESEPLSTGFGFGIGSHRRYGGFGIQTGSDIRQYDIGILVIDIYDAETQDMLWRGRGSEIVSRHPTPQQNSEMARLLVEAVLAQFPPY